MLSAIIGLLGVIVGAMISTGTQVWLDRRKENVVARRARRLVAHELIQNCTAINVFARDEGIELGIIGPVLDQLLPKMAWDEYRADLASTLDDNEWQTVLNGYSTIQVLRTLLQAHGIRATKAGVDPGDGLRSLRAAMKGSASTLEKSINVLTGKSGFCHERI